MANPPICPLYGVVIREASSSGDRELMQSILKVSQHLLNSSSPVYDDECVNDWRSAEAELRKALG